MKNSGLIAIGHLWANQESVNRIQILDKFVTLMFHEMPDLLIDARLSSPLWNQKSTSELNLITSIQLLNRLKRPGIDPLPFQLKV